MTTVRTAAQGADAETVQELHARWTALLLRMTGGPLNRRPQPTSGEMRQLVKAARELEDRIADTPGRTIAEVRLKLKMAGSAGMLTKYGQKLVESASVDLRQLDPSLRLRG